MKKYLWGLVEGPGLNGTYTIRLWLTTISTGKARHVPLWICLLHCLSDVLTGVVGLLFLPLGWSVHNCDFLGWKIKDGIARRKRAKEAEEHGDERL